jgi:hypothetical protein
MSGQDLDMPALRVADLDEAGIDDLFMDLSAAGELFEVVVKASSRARCASTACSLDAAREALRSEDVLAVQVRYRFEDRAWCDTLMRSAGGARLVRAELPLGPPVPPAVSG